MKVNRYLLLFCFVGLFILSSVKAQTSYCKNLGFELGSFINWTGYTWRQSSLVPSINTSPVAGIVNRRQTIISDTYALDPNTGNLLKKIPPGYKYSARLGDELISSDGSPRCWQQSLRYRMTIDSSNALLIFKFAVVLQYASDHSAINEPRFRLKLYDSNGNALPDCSNYDVYSSNNLVKGFKNYYPPGAKDPIQWRDWTTVGANLIKYIGQTITVEFMTADCLQRYHFGYAYFVAECHPLYITVKYCGADTTAALTAPLGFEKYKWVNSNGVFIDTTQTINVMMPTQKISYTCTMTSATGCVVALNSSILKYIPKGDFSSFMLDCFSNKVQFINLSSSNHGSLSYNWNFWEGVPSTQQDPAFKFITSGMHKVTLVVSNPPSSCRDTITKDVESFSPPLVKILGDSTYCPGHTTLVKAIGADEYTWSTGSNKDSIEVGAPGGKLWMMGRSTTGCISDTVRTIIREDAPWNLITSTDSIICGNGSVVLSAEGAAGYTWNKVISQPAGGYSYLWTKGITTDSIVASDPGSYLLLANNARGCEKSTLFRVAAYPLPLTSFTFSPDALDSKHAVLTGTIPAENGTNYVWNMGDGTIGNGQTVSHHYGVSNDLLFYRLSMVATSPKNCIDSSAVYIDVIPFIPNVFTPNEDGVNDIFMKGFEVEIIDRNGLQIFRGSNGWNGLHNGDPADPDTYFYLVTYNDRNEKKHSKKGYITLVR